LFGTCSTISFILYLRSLSVVISSVISIILNVIEDVTGLEVRWNSSLDVFAGLYYCFIPFGLKVGQNVDLFLGPFAIIFAGLFTVILTGILLLSVAGIPLLLVAGIFAAGLFAVS